MIDLQEALLCIRDNIIFDTTEIIQIQESLNRVVVEDVLSTMDIPHYDYSEFDGYAIRIQDGKAPVIKYRVEDVVFAGDEGIELIDIDCAVKVTTGAIVPKNCDMVIKKEDVEIVDEMIAVKNHPKSGYGIVRAGNRLRKNMKIISKDHTITPEIIEKLVMVGIRKVRVYSPINIAILNTGSEIIPIDQPCQKGKIYPSNGFYIAAKLQQSHLHVTEVSISNDDKTDIIKQLENLRDKVNLIISTGGLGKGDKDLMLESLEHSGYQLIFNGVDVRGCQNVILSEYQNSFLLSLSGNPYAMKRGLDILGRPVLLQLTHKEELQNG